MPWGLVGVWTLGQSSCQASYSSIFPTGVLCAYGCRGGLTMGRVFRFLGLGGRVGLGRMESRVGVQPGGRTQLVNY